MPIFPEQEEIMDLHLRDYQWATRHPDWTSAAVAGFVGGAVLMLVELLWSFSIDGASSWATSHMVAGIAMGPEVARGTGFSVAVVAVALFIHYLLGIAFGLVLGAFISPFHLDTGAGASMTVGAVAGFLLYLFNFYGMTAFFPWFAQLRGGATLLAHIIFGMVTACAYLYLERRT